MEARRMRGDAAARALGSPVRLLRTHVLPSGSIELWGTFGSPPRLRAFFVREPAEPLVIDESWDTFATMIQESKVELVDPVRLAELFVCGPRRLSLCIDQDDVPAQYRDSDWQPRALADGSWTGHGVDYAQGRWVNLLIRADRRVFVTDLGSAPRFPRR